MSASGLLNRVLAGFIESLQPLREAIATPESLLAFLREFGWVLTPTDIDRVNSSIGALSSLPADPSSLNPQQVSSAVANVVQTIRSIAQSGAPAAFASTFPRELLDCLVYIALARSNATAFSVLHFVGVLGERRVAANAATGRAAYVAREIHWDRLSRLATQPLATVTQSYGWGAQFDGEAFLRSLGMLIRGLGGRANLHPTDSAVIDEYYAPNTPGAPSTTSLIIAPPESGTAPTTASREKDAGIVLMALPIPSKVDVIGLADGIALIPVIAGQASNTIQLSDNVSLAVAGDFVARPVRAEIHPDRSVVRATAGDVHIDASARLDAKAPSGAPWILFGDANSSRLEVSAARAGLAFSGQIDGDADLRVEVGIDAAALIIDFSEGDSFLQQTVSSQPARSPLSFVLKWSSKSGFSLGDQPKLQLGLPVHQSLGPVAMLERIDLALGAGPGKSIALDALVTGSTAIGPVSASVAELGMRLLLEPRTDAQPPGNLGNLDLQFGFKPPKGIGLSLEAGFVKGGGYFFTDPANHEYAGALELQLGKIGVKAIGALTTRPDGWSLILLVYGQFPPIQLSFGFTLNGIGGMIGVQHGVDVTQLILGMQTKAFDDILFPENPVADAPRILSRLRTLFPIAPRSLTFGPMVDIGWGTPRIVFIRLGILVQLDNVFDSAPGPVSFTRIVLIGQLRVAIGPTKENAEITIIKLVVDILGFWEFDKKRCGFLARLRDSSIAKVDIVGGLGVWGEYGDHPTLLLAAGGFNTRFKDVPADMSGVIDRLGAAFKVGRFSLTLSGYFALTPATLQAGLDLAATAQLGPVGVKGTIGFEVLIYREPDTHFIADFHIIAEVTYKGHSLAGVKVVGTLVGPGLWHLVGELSFSILWWDISKSFDESWGSAPSLSSVQTDVQALLTAELAKRENWSAQLPAGAEAMVTLAPPMGELATLAHPLGRFVFSQCVTPLGLTLERYGSTRITGRNRFDLSSVTAGGQAIAVRTPVREHFARAQFVETTEEEKLTRPSFEEMDSGVEFSSEAYRVSANALAADMEYETAYLDIDPRGFNRTRRDPALSRVALDHGLIRALATQGAAARAPQRARERMRAKTQVRVAVSTAPLAAADRSAFAADSAVPMTGQARSVEMIAEQRFKPKDAARSQLIEEFELA